MPVITPRPKVRLRVKPALLPLEIELQAGDEAIQWRYVGTETWNDLIDYADIDASVTIGTVTTLAAGSSATVTNVGTAQDVVLDIGIPRGQDGVMASVVAGTNITVDATDPANPIVSAISSAAVDSVNGATGVVVLDAGDIPVTPVGSIAATDVQTALQELDTEKQPLDLDLSALATAFSRATASGPASLDFAEDTDNGTNRIRVTAPSSISSDVTVTLPAATDTLVGKATTDSLTNKSFDANGAGNALTNVEVADFAAAAIVTAAEGLASSDNDTSLPTTAAVIDYVEANGGGTPTLGTEQATTSGTTKDFGIPAGVVRIVVMLNGVSFNGAQTFGIQIGDAGGIETTGYAGIFGNSQSTTDRFSIYTAAASLDVIYGAVTLTRFNDSHTWMATGIIGADASADVNVASAGRKALSAELTTVRLMGGTFDAGAVNVLYE